VSGALSKIFAAAPYSKTSAEWYSVWIAIFTAVISLLLLLLFFRQSNEKFTLKALAASAGNGLFNRLANMLLVISLIHIDASVQYTLVTGGVIIVSTVISLFGKNKPSKKELLSVAVAFLGTMALFIIKA
jgi:multidrug transporter EmrE-like cation transporter